MWQEQTQAINSTHYPDDNLAIGKRAKKAHFHAHIKNNVHKIIKGRYLSGTVSVFSRGWKNS
jgi:hypothetical protein